MRKYLLVATFTLVELGGGGTEEVQNVEVRANVDHDLELGQEGQDLLVVANI